MIKWFKSLKLVYKISFLFTLSVFLISISYVVIRAFQYKAYNNTLIERFLSEEANIFFKIDRLNNQYEQFGKTHLAKILTNGFLKDQFVGEEVNKCLISQGLPTLKELEDKRFRKKFFGSVSEDIIFRLLGKEIVGNIKVKDSFSNAKIAIATRLCFTDFLLIPFAKIFSGFIGMQSFNENGLTYFSIKLPNDLITFVTVSENVLIISNDKDLLLDTLLAKKHPAKPNNPFWLKINFDSDSSALNQIKDVINSFPVAETFHYVNFESIKSLDVTIDFSDKEIHINTILNGDFLQGVDGNFENIIPLMPQNAFFINVSKGSIYTLWHKLKYRTSIKDSSGKPFTEFLKKNLGYIFQILSEQGLEVKLFSQFGNYGCILLGESTITREEEGESNSQNIPTFALIVPVKEQATVMQTLDDITKQILANNSQIGSMKDMEYKGHLIKYFEKAKINIKEGNIVQPSYAIFRDKLIITTFNQFTLAIIDALLDSSDMAKKLPDFILKDEKLLTDERDFITTSIIFLEFNGLKKAVENITPFISEKLIDTEENRRKIRLQVEKSEHDPNKVDKLVIETLCNQIFTKENEIRKQAKLLNYLNYIAIKALLKRETIVIKTLIKVSDTKP